MKKSLYQIIVDDLTDQIQKGLLGPDAKVPTEQALADQYTVSRITSKRALNELEQAGLIYRKQGSGSFVKPRANSKTGVDVPLAQPAQADQCLIVLVSDANTTAAALATALLIQFQKEYIDMSVQIILEDQLQGRLDHLPKRLLLCLIGDRFHDNLIYQLYEKNILFMQLATMPDPLESPQIFLSTEIAAQDLCAQLATQSQQAQCFIHEQKTSLFKTQAEKVSLLKAAKALNRTNAYGLSFSDIPADWSTFPRDENVALIFNDFFDLYACYLADPKPTAHVYALFSAYLQPEQVQSLLQQPILFTTASKTDILQAAVQLQKMFKKNTGRFESITVSAQLQNKPS